MVAQSYVVSNISCAHCTHTIERELKLLEGVRSVTAEGQSKRVTVGVDEPDTLRAVESTLAEIGYPGVRV